MGGLEKTLLERLERIELAPRRMLLDTGEVRATVPMLRGVWGRALRELDAGAYELAFEGRRALGVSGAEKSPLYVVRPAPADPEFAPAVEWILIGAAARSDGVLTRAWDVAARMGLGPGRKPFAIRQVLWLNPRGEAVPRPLRWSLRAAAEAMPADIAKTEIALEFDAPLRVLRRGKLVDRPTFVDIAVAAARRVAVLSGAEEPGRERELVHAVADAAARIPAGGWKGRRADFVRWSGAQRREVDMHGVSGEIRLPEGPGELWPLLAAGSWVHIGKGTVFGLGQLELARPPNPAGR